MSEEDMRGGFQAHPAREVKAEPALQATVLPLAKLLGLLSLVGSVDMRLTSRRLKGHASEGPLCNLMKKNDFDFYSTSLP